jgi:PAS domain S-box-containing protein
MVSKKPEFGKFNKGAAMPLSSIKKETATKERRRAALKVKEKKKRTEETLRESEVRYRELFENINSGVAVYTVIGNGQDFIIKDFNRAAEKIDHDRRERLIGKSIFEVRPGIEQFGLIEVFRRVWRTGKPANHPVALYQDKKLRGWYENHVYKLPSGELVAVFEDVTERMRAENKIQFLAKFPNENPNPILRLARDGTLLYINEAGLSLLPEWHLQVGQAASPILREAALQAMDRGSPQMVDFEHGQQAYSFSITPIVGAGYVNLYARNVTERRQMEKALRESESNLRALALELSRTEERERQRLAGSLHDEIGQSLALVRLKLGGLAAAAKSRSDKRSINALRDILETVIEQTHGLIFELSPPVLHQLGLAAAIEWAGEKIGRDHGLDFKFDDDGVAKSLSSDLQAILFRCVRELMLNAAKHGKAKHLTVAIARKGETDYFTVADDGIGFDVPLQSARTEDRGYGLFSIREHLAMIGGACRIQSAPGQGTRITLTVPAADGTPRENEADGQKTLWPPVPKNDPK